MFMCKDSFIVTGSVDRQLIVWSREGEVVHTWNEYRIVDLVGAENGTRVAAHIGGTKSFVVYDIMRVEEEFKIDESEKIIGMHMS